MRATPHGDSPAPEQRHNGMHRQIKALPALISRLPLVTKQARGRIATDDVIQLAVADLFQLSCVAICHECPPQIWPLPWSSARRPTTRTYRFRGDAQFPVRSIPAVSFDRNQTSQSASKDVCGSTSLTIAL